MRVMVIMKANAQTEAGVLPDEMILTEMGKFNEELVKAGVMLAGEGLQARSKGARVKFSQGKKTVIDGPFTETKELVAGFWLWQVRSLEEAIEWVKRGPMEETEVEIRRVFEPDDFGEALTPELRKAEERLRTEAARRALALAGNGHQHPARDRGDLADRIAPPHRRAGAAGRRCRPGRGAGPGCLRGRPRAVA